MPNNTPPVTINVETGLVPMVAIKLNIFPGLLELMTNIDFHRIHYFITSCQSHDDYQFLLESIILITSLIVLAMNIDFHLKSIILITSAKAMTIINFFPTIILITSAAATNIIFKIILSFQVI